MEGAERDEGWVVRKRKRGEGSRRDEGRVVRKRNRG